MHLNISGQAGIQGGNEGIAADVDADEHQLLPTVAMLALEVLCIRFCIASLSMKAFSSTQLAMAKLAVGMLALDSSINSF